jgi:hypothetical protein
MKPPSPGLPLLEEQRARVDDSFGEARLGETRRTRRGVGKAESEDALRVLELAREGDVAIVCAIEGPGESSMLIEILPAIGSTHEPRALVGEWAVGAESERIGAVFRDQGMLVDPSGVALPGPVQVRRDDDDELVGTLQIEANEKNRLPLRSSS